MAEEQEITVTLPASTWTSILTVLKVEAEREAENDHGDLAKEIVNVWDELEQQINQ